MIKVIKKKILRCNKAHVFKASVLTELIMIQESTQSHKQCNKQYTKYKDYKLYKYYCVIFHTNSRDLQNNINNNNDNIGMILNKMECNGEVKCTCIKKEKQQI